MWATILPGFDPDLFPLHWHQLGNSGLILTSVALHPFLIWVEDRTTGIKSHVSAQCQLEELLGAQLILTEQE